MVISTLATNCRATDRQCNAWSETSVSRVHSAPETVHSPNSRTETRAHIQGALTKHLLPFPTSLTNRLQRGLPAKGSTH